MIEAFAFLTGLISSCYLATIYFQCLILLVYHLPFRLWQPYTALYDAFENRHTYELLGGDERFKNHNTFLSIYCEQRPLLTRRFRSRWNAYAWQVGRDYGLAIVAALGIFWNVFWAFLAPFLLIQLIAFLHIHFVKKYRADFFACLMISLLIDGRP